MTKLKGTETKEIIIDVKDEDLIKGIRERVHLPEGYMNETGDEIGYWYDASSDYSNYEDWQWHSISRNKKMIELMKAIELIENYLKENK